MDEKFQITLFITVFILIYGSLHLFVLSKLSKMFKIEKTWVFYALLIILVVSYIVATVLESNFSNVLTRDLYILSSTWMGVLFFLFCALIIFDIVQIFIPLPALLSGIVIILFVGLLSIYSIVNAFVMHTKVIELESDKIEKQLIIVQVSDIHLGPVHDKAFLEKTVKNINELKPDIVLITGDILDGPYVYKKETFEPLKEINAKVYFSTGNHDFYAGIDRLTELLNHTNVTMLRNELVSYHNIQIIGIDDAENRRQLGTQLKIIEENNKVNYSKYTIVMYHRPTGYSAAADRPIDLMVSGHTHAGQIFPFNLLSALVVKPVRGLHNYNNTFLYVSSGVGTWGPPMRLGSRSEIVKFVIKPKK